MLYSHNPILMYHHIAPVPADLNSSPHACLFVPRHEFAQQLDALLSMGYRTVTSQEYTQSLSNPSDRVVWITFDDGFLDNYEAAYQELAKRQMIATFFVVTDRIADPKSTDYMTPDLLREMHRNGMEIGSHTCSHPKLARLNSNDLGKELQVSKTQLEDWLAHRVSALCYPFGNVSAQVIEAAEASGYDLAVSTIRGNCNGMKDRYTLNRVMVASGRVGLRFRYSFSPIYQFLHERKNRKRWTELKN